MQPLLATILLLAAVASQQPSAQAWWWSNQAPAAPTGPSTAGAPQQVPQPPAPVPYAPPQAAAPVQSVVQAQPVQAVAEFDMDGAKGTFKFSQRSPAEATEIEYDVMGLQGNNRLYHVHVRPVPPFDAQLVRSNSSAIAALCGDPATGGHLNPHHITEKLPAKSAPLDKYETGDLSGKHGPLQAMSHPGHADHYVGKFVDDKLPMSGANSIVGRSVVIHKNDGKRWVCASIKQL